MIAWDTLRGPYVMIGGIYCIHQIRQQKFERNIMRFLKVRSMPARCRLRRGQGLCGGWAELQG